MSRSAQGRWRLTINIDVDVKRGRSADRVCHETAQKIESALTALNGRIAHGFIFAHHSALPKRGPRSLGKGGAR